MKPTIEDAKAVARLLQQRQGPIIDYLNPRTVRVKGLRYLGSGSFRQVWRYGDYVLKLPRLRLGMEHNRRELERYGRLPEEHRRYLARPYCLVGRVLVMEYVEAHKYRFGRRYEQVSNWLVDHLGLCDTHRGNLGYRLPEGTPVVWDYAI